MKNDIIIQGFLFDEKSTYQRGPGLAPPLIREALHSGSMNYYAESGFSVNQPYIKDKGDFEVENYFDIEKITTNHLKTGAKILTLGGDHSITFPIVKALANRYEKIDILHFDAHPDLYDNYDGDPYAHACPFARIMEHQLAENLVQVGIRTLNDHQKMQADKFGVNIIQMKEYDPSKIPSFNNPVYISLDMDAFDPAFAPGVSHHEPGGFSTRQMLDCIQQLNTTIIGADIVEYNPKRDFQNMTAFLAAKMMKELLAKMI